MRYDVDSSFSLREKPRLRVFVNSLLRRIFVPKREEVKGEFGKFHNEELHNLCYVGATLYYETISIINLSMKGNALSNFRIQMQ
jgi:hypothetical protein